VTGHRGTYRFDYANRIQCDVRVVAPVEAVTGPMRATFALGLSHYDAPPSGTLGDLEALREQDAFRFANRLHAWVDFDGDRTVAYGQTAA